MSRNYIIINGVNSLTIPGLAIKTLPPITKPLMRTIKEEIDGRNGDINTELGYQAYDKKIEIGLFGSYDINQIIAFFNSSGTIVFSEEPDKYYNFKILDKIDFEKLIKFRSALFNIHCQPFKYPLTDTPQEISYQYVEGTGESLTLDHTSDNFMQVDLKGNTSQASEPSPTSPVPVNVVSGDNSIEICGENVFSSTQFLYDYWNRQYFIKGADENSLIVTAANSQQWTSISFIFQNKIKIGHNYYFSCEGASSIQFNGVSNLNISGTTASFTANQNGIKIKLFASSYPSTITKLLLIDITNNNSRQYTPYTGKTYPINLPVENLYNATQTDATINNLTIKGNENNVFMNGTPNIEYRAIFGTSYFKKGTYTFSMTLSDGALSSNTTFYLYKGTSSSTSWDYIAQLSVTTTKNNISKITFTINEDTYLYLGNYVYTSQSYTNAQFMYMIEKGSKANTFTPYGTTPIELCKIDTYQDYIYKENDKWYLHKEIGKKVLDGTEEEWAVGSSATTRSVYSINTFTDRKTTLSNSNFISDKFAYLGNAQSTDLGYAMSFNTGNYSNYLYIQVPLNVVTYGNVNDFKNWLVSNKTTIYYILATPTNTEITYEPLIAQLNKIEKAVSYDSQTNIMQENNDKPFIIYAKAIKKGTDTSDVINIGNIYSKPILSLEGTGIVHIYKNGNEVFQVDLTEKNKITIDTDGMEAIETDTNILANRQVIGNYSLFKLEPGTSTIKFSGALSSATLTKYVRWL